MKQDADSTATVPATGPPLMRNVPNALSIFRILLAAAFPFLPPMWWLPVVLTAAVSDVADGVIARRFHVGSHSGALLDAIADKAFVLSVLLTLVLAGPVEWWQVLLVLLRDFSVLIVALYASMVRDWRAFRRMTPGVSGKIATGFIFAWLVAVTGGWNPLIAPLFVLAVACSAAAASVYLHRFVAALRARREFDA